MKYPADEPASTALERFTVGVAVLVLLLAQLAVTNSLSLLSQPLWLDECLTKLLANDPSFVHEMAALKGGVDTTPPTYYLILRGIRAIVGTLDAVELRTISLFSIVIAMVGVYTICRRFFGRLASCIGVLAIVGHQAIVEEMFQARHYGIWLGSIVWLCCFQLGARQSRRAIIGACLCAVLVTTMHWLGILAVAMIGVTDFVLHRSIKRMIPMLCGGVALCACLPFLFGQRAGLAVPTWISPLTVGQIRSVIAELFASPLLIAVVLMFWISRVVDRGCDKPKRDLIDLAPTTALLMFPIALIVLSKIMQPMLLTRYVTPALFPVALLAAELASRSVKSIRVILIVLLATIGAVTVRNVSATVAIASARAAGVVLAIDEVVKSQNPLPVIVLRRLELYPAIAIRPEIAGDAAMLRFDFPMPFELKTRTRYEEIMAGRVSKFYSQYQLMNLSALIAKKHFFVISPTEDADEHIQKVFAGAKIEQRGHDLFEVTLP